MKNTPKISIIIPCFNSEKFISDCLDSIISQSFKDYEVIFVDGKSTDNTLEILKSYQSKHENISVFSKQNLTAGSARNFGITKANGDFIWFVDADDFLEPNALQTLHNATLCEKSDIYFFGFNYYDNKTQQKQEEHLFKSFNKYFISNNKKIKYSKTTFDDNVNLFMWSYAAPWNKLYSKDFITNNNLQFDNLYSTNDRTFYFSSLIKSASVTTIDSLLINYRINNDSSLTGMYSMDKFNNRVLAFKSTQKFIPNNLKDLFFDVTIADFINFHKRSKSNESWNIFCETVKFFKNNIIFDNLNTKNNLWKFWYNLFCESEHLINLNTKSIIPIVLISSNQSQLNSVLNQITNNTNNNNFYEIYVLNFNKQNSIYLKNNVCIKQLDILPIFENKEFFEDIKLEEKTYIPFILPYVFSHFEQFMFIDCDDIDVLEPLEPFSKIESTICCFGFENKPTTSFVIYNNKKLEPVKFAKETINFINNNHKQHFVKSKALSMQKDILISTEKNCKLKNNYTKNNKKLRKNKRLKPFYKTKLFFESLKTNGFKATLKKILRKIKKED